MALGFFSILSIFIVLDLVWWRAADHRLRKLQHALPWRMVLAAFMAAVLGYLLCSRIALRLLGGSDTPVPIVVHAVVYLWHFLVLPAAMIGLVIAVVWRWIGRRVSNRRGRAAVCDLAPQSSSDADAFAGADLSDVFAPPRPMAPTRRQMLAAAAIAVPPLASVAAAVGTVRTMYGRRLRHFDLALPTLPVELDGMTIVHISDTHIGKFLHPDRLDAIAEDVNKLDADFVVFTGDLIDLSLDDLRHGIKFLRKVKCQAICEGNHDLLQGNHDFESGMLDARLPLIVNDQVTRLYTSRDGQSFPVQFFGVPWTASDEERSMAVQDLAPITHASTHAFRILLAHHPHSFDAAAAAGFPLVLSGHTHGGQLNFNDRIGIGSLRFKYISGLYTKEEFPGSNLIVNNGLGNWFPLRINAPAEIVHITLKRSG